MPLVMGPLAKLLTIYLGYWENVGRGCGKAVKVVFLEIPLRVYPRSGALFCMLRGLSYYDFLYRTPLYCNPPDSDKMFKLVIDSAPLLSTSSLLSS